MITGKEAFAQGGRLFFLAPTYFPRFCTFPFKFFKIAENYAGQPMVAP
jgi:hypothetical protein